MEEAYHKVCKFAIVLVLATTASAGARGDEREPGAEASAGSGWTPFTRGGYVHQFETDLDGGGDFDADRFFIQAGAAYTMGPGRRVSLAVAYGRDRYDFSGSEGFAALRPWERINQLRFSAPVTWKMDDEWSLFLVPTLRLFGEAGTGLEDSATGGGFIGFSYRFSDTLTLGPGLGVLSRLEDSASVFPVLIVDWKIADRLRLETGRGLGATQGPGLTLNFEASNHWNLALGGRFESLRFRLNDSGSAPGGVGEDRSIPLFLSATYTQGRNFQLSALGGVELGGELRLEDSKGKKIEKESYDAAPFLGFAFNYRF